jgi:predicted nucleic acid-binding protein
VTTRLLLDNSAWARLNDAGVTDARAAEIAAALEGGEIGTCLPFLLEAGYSARNAAEHEALMHGLLALPHFRIDEHVEQRAIEAQRQLARAGHHRLPPVDVLVAAIADRHDVAVLHYDHDYDLIVEKTDLRFESEWLVPRGTL